MCVHLCDEFLGEGVEDGAGDEGGDVRREEVGDEGLEACDIVGGKEGGEELLVFEGLFGGAVGLVGEGLDLCFVCVCVCVCMCVCVCIGWNPFRLFFVSMMMGEVCACVYI